MSLRTHKDLDVWKEAMKLTKEIYTLTKSFPKEELYGITAQMRRAAVSIPSNIAEGAARATNKEFIQFLHIALGSLSELETQCILAVELELMNQFPQESIELTRKLILGLIRHLQNRNRQSITHNSSPITDNL